MLTCRYHYGITGCKYHSWMICFSPMNERKSTTLYCPHTRAGTLKLPFFLEGVAVGRGSNIWNKIPYCVKIDNHQRNYNQRQHFLTSPSESETVRPCTQESEDRHYGGNRVWDTGVKGITIHINYPALRAPVEGYAFFSSSLGIVKASFDYALVHSSNLKIRRGVGFVRHQGATNIINNRKMSS